MATRSRSDEAGKRRAGQRRTTAGSQAELVCRFTPDGKLSHANPAYRRYFGLEAEGELPESLASLIHPDDVAQVQAVIASLTPASPAVTIENRVRCGDGTIRWTQWANHAVFDEKGRSLEFEAVGRDITEQRRAEEDAGRLAAIVTGADDAIISKTLEGVITSWNPAAAAMFGYTPEEAVGRPITLIIPPERLGEEREILARLNRGEAIEHFETERLTKDGRLLSVSLSVSPVRDSRGRVIGASKILRDMTERREVEGRLKSTVQTLEALYRLADLMGRARTRPEVCEAALKGVLSVARTERASVLIFDESGVMRFVCWSGLSEGYRARTNGHSPWKRDTRDPRPVLVEDVLQAPELGDLRDVILREGIRSLGFFPLVHQGELLGKFMLYYDAPHVFSPEELRLAATAAQHISQGLARADSEAALERLLRREQSSRQEAESARSAAVRANREKDEFLAMLAHELRNPVGVIVNAVSLIEESPEPGHLLFRATGMIRRQAGHLARLLDDLLDVARITKGRIQMVREAIELRAVMDLAVEGQGHQLQARRQRLLVDRPHDGVTVVGDPVRLQQVIGNLLNNASKYSPPEACLRIGLKAEGREAVLRVSDEGAGIPPDKLESIFELFSQANPDLARTQGGLGIGLTLVKRIVELHCGTVMAHSEGLGRGAEFTVRLPLAEAGVVVPNPPAVLNATAPRRVLLIEDHEDGREALAGCLATYGHEVLSAATGQQGIDAAISALPDVVLVDIGLPDLDGYEVARRLRRQLATRIPLVALTGYGQPEDRARATDAGFDAHLVKPIEPAKLAQVLEDLTQPTRA
jgi:PAS domain S-box-containing protein